LDDAYSVLLAAEQSIERNVPFVDIRSDLNAAWVKYWLATGELPLAERWMEEWLKNHAPGEAYSMSTEQDEITWSRILIAKQQFQEVMPTLFHMAESAEIGGRMGRLIEILVLQAIAFREQKKGSEALKVLEKCLCLGESEGFMRVFLDSGEPVRELLSAYVHTSACVYKSYAQRLLDAFSGPSRGTYPATEYRPG
jgi:LuxR family maltose regulon positive regulatory protein